MPSPDPAGFDSASPPLVMEVREDGFAWLRIGAPGEPATRVGARFLERLDELLNGLDPLIEEERVRAMVLCGDQPGMFVAGSEVADLQALSDAEEATHWALAGQRVLRRLEELPIPTIAAIDGPCLGGGLELALSCSYRLASDASSTRLGLPQVRLGLIPSLGGTVRLPRLIGIQASLEMIVSGQSIGAEAALRLGLVDEVLSTRHFQSATERFAENRVQRGRLRTGARRRVPRRLLEDTAPGRRLVVARAARRLLPGVESLAPSAERALRTVAEGMSLPLDRAFALEAGVAGELIASEPARALLHAFRLLNDARRPPEPAVEHPIARAAVLGAGTVGSEIAFLLTSAELPVLLKDRRRDSLLRGGQHVLALLRRDEGDGTISPRDAGRRGEMVSSATGFGGFGTVDLVVAAVGSRLEVTEEALREAEEHTRPDCVLACRPPEISPSRVQQGMARPERVVGLAFARPADLFPLLEIVAGEATAAATVDACRDLARRLGRAPVVVPDGPDTPGGRLLGVFFAEGLRLLEEGATVGEIDRAAEAFGITMGPFRRMDAMGVDHSLRLLDRLGASCGERMRASPIVERLSGAPPLFYRYRKGLPAGPNASLPAGISAPAAGFAQLIQTRLLLVLVNEAALLLEERPGISPGDVDVVALAGLGFPRVRGGLLYHAERLGAGRLVDLLHSHADRFGPRFAPAPLLQDAGQDEGTFSGWTTGHAGAGVLR